MSYPDDLIELAVDLLLGIEKKTPNQACWRRAVSTAYYALFHELTQAAVHQWAIERHRSGLVRTIEHKRVRSVCDEVAKSRTAPNALKQVAQSFIQLQQDRHSADYDLGKVWSETATFAAVQKSSKALTEWTKIRTDPSAEDFLMKILFPRDPVR